MILYGTMANVSVVQLFVAGIVPGLLGGLAMMVLCWRLAVKYNLPRDERFDLKKVWRSLVDAGWALLLPVIILSGIFGGIVTATEGAGVAVVAALLIGVFIYREVKLDQIKRILTLNIAVGQQTPPVASVLATACSIAKTGIWPTTRANLPFIAILIGVVLLVSYVPDVSLGLVRWIYG